MSRPAGALLSFAPVVDELGTRFDLELAAHCGVSRRQIIRWRTVGVPVRSADGLAIRLGLHPLTLWGEAWTAAEDALQGSYSDTQTARASRRYKQRVRDRAREETEAWEALNRSWWQWSAQQDRNAYETSQRATQAPQTANGGLRHTG